MTTRMASISNPLGLHARPASRFVELAQSFECEILIRNVTKGLDFSNAKSIMHVLNQDIARDEEIELEAEGPDADRALACITEFLSDMR